MSALFKKLFFAVLTVCFFMPVFSIAQTGLIDSAEKALKIAEKDTNDLRPYCHALFSLKKAYRLYLERVYLNEGERCTTWALLGKDSVNLYAPCDFGNDSLDLIEKNQVLKDIDRLDSLKNAGQIVNFQKKRIRIKELRLFEFYFGLDDLSSKMVRKGKLKSAAYYSQLGFKYWKRVNDTTSAEFINKAVKIATDLIRSYNEVEAIQLLEPILPLARQKYIQLPSLSKERLPESSGEKDEINADAYLAMLLQNLGEAYRKTSSWDKAAQFLKEAIDVFEPLSKKFRIYDGKDSSYTLNRHSALLAVSYNKYSTILSLADLYESQSRFDDALELINQQIKNKAEILKQDDHYLNLFCEHKLRLLSVKFDFKGFKETVEQFRREGISVRDTSNRQELLFSGQFEKAMKEDEIMRLRYKKMYRKYPEIDIAFLNMRSISLSVIGNFEASKRVLDSAYLIAQNNADISSDTKISLLDSYATLAKDMGQNEKAFAYQKECFNARKKQLYPLSIEMANEWSKLADIYSANQMLDSAVFCLFEALDIYEKAFGIKHYDYNSTVNKLIQVLNKKKMYTDAETLANDVLENSKDYFDLMPILALQSYDVVIPTFIANGDIAKAKDYQQKAAQLYLTIYRDSSRISFLRTQRYALQIADNQANTSDISAYTKVWLSGIKQLIGRQMTFIPDGEKTQFIQSLNICFSAVASVLSRNTEGSKYLYDLALLQNGIALTDTRSFQKRSWDLPEGETKNTALQLVAKMKLLNNDNMAFDVRIQYNREADSLRTLLKNDKEGKKLFTTDWLETSYKDIQSRLKPNEVAIEFLDFNYHTPTLPTDSTMYYALVLRNTGLPSVIELFEEKELTAILTNDKSKVNDLYDNKKDKHLTKLLWQPLENAQILRGGETVYYAPSSLLHRVSFAALPNLNDTFRLCDRYNLVQMNSTRDIGTQTDKPFNWQTTSAAFFGNISYWADSTQLVKANSRFLENSPLLRMRSFVLTNPADSLMECLTNPIISDETKPIDSLFQLKHIKTTRYEKSAASEDAFRILGTVSVPAPTLLLISTHGVYETTMGRRLTPQQSLHQNYLLMAGCDRHLCYKKQSIPKMEDGVLTAAEIAQMNLSETQLVVLSACQTGLGDIKGREGVYGLSRGFKLAGARYTLSSLWSVPDMETAEFMNVFYTQLLDNQTIPDAFAKTQAAMRTKYANNTSAWAAWVLMR